MDDKTFAVAVKKAVSKRSSDYVADVAEEIARDLAIRFRDELRNGRSKRAKEYRAEVEALILKELHKLIPRIAKWASQDVFER